MATRKVKLTGTAEWAKVFEQNRDLKGYEGAYEAHDGACTIDLLMDEANVAALKASRSIKNPKDMGNGIYKAKFVRKFNTGRDWDSGAPIVTNADGDDWSFDTDGPIGNGSTVEVMLSVYDTSYKNRPGTRLDSVRVINHVPVDNVIQADVVSADTLPSADNNKAEQQEVLF